jgi:hypothetical protein
MEPRFVGLGFWDYRGGQYSSFISLCILARIFSWKRQGKGCCAHTTPSLISSLILSLREEIRPPPPLKFSTENPLILSHANGKAQTSLPTLRTLPFVAILHA